MTIHEASEKYNIPIKILREYESWGLCGEVKKIMGSWHYDDSDIERLSTIMTLHDVGFTNDEVEEYMKLLLQGKATEKERLKMLGDKRYSTLDEIHFKEKQLDRLEFCKIGGVYDEEKYRKQFSFVPYSAGRRWYYRKQ